MNYHKLIFKIKFRSLFHFILLPLIYLFSCHSFSDEGMWLFNDFPKASFNKKFGFTPDEDWLNRVRLSSAKLGNGCSGSFISKKGLVLTNHHCAHSCIEQLSDTKENFIQNGFNAKSLKEERKCPELEISRLIEITDVTNQILNSTLKLAGEAFKIARNSVIAKIEDECSKGKDNLRCDVITLFQGGKYHLYKYERYQDVRLVFAPEFNIAFFGGDPDNFMYPRYDLDMSLLRVYKNNEPLENKYFFPWSKTPLKEGDLTFVTGHPGRTNRLSTISDIDFLREQKFSITLSYLSELRGLLTEYQKRNEEAQLSSHDILFGVENSLKSSVGRFQALNNKEFLKNKRAEEAQLRKKSPKSFDNLESTYKKYITFYEDLRFLEFTDGYSKLLESARLIVRSGVELNKPNQDRLKEFTESRLPEIKQTVFSEAKIYKQTEITLLSHYFTKLREVLSPDHELIQKLFKVESPEKLAQRIIEKTNLTDLQIRKDLWGQNNKILSSTDPLIETVRTMDPYARTLREKFENEIESIFIAEHEKIAQTRFNVLGKNSYPDATGTLRISFGQVKGYKENEKQIAPFTTIGGAFNRATSYEPFALPPKWIQSKSQLNLDTSFNMVTTNDIIGGNSGSPVINKAGEIVGLIFDGNIQGLGGDYYFDPNVNRAVSVTHSGILEALNKIYKNEYILKELSL